ncbi:MAG: peptide synthetase, partial [Clostridia bacterium]
MSEEARDGAIRWQPHERLHHLFENRCDDLIRRGKDHHPAIITAEEQISYRQLEERANQLARYLRRWGLQSGDRVGILLERSPLTYVLLLAVLKADLAYAPLDPGFPRERLAFIAEDATLKAIITTSDFRKSLQGLAPLICLDEAENAIRQERPARMTEAEKGLPRDDLCYIIYTSGSTGRPKGVAIEHPGVCNFVRVAGEVYGIREEDRMYQGMSVSFDFSVEETWVPLVAGATLIPAPGGRKLLGDELGDFLRRHQVSAMCAVPTLLATIEEDIPSLRLILVGGEACPAELVQRWSRPGRRILNTYGPTETTVTATWAELHPDKPVTIGRPMPTYSVVILDENQRPAPDGEPGEICIAGIGLARGYLNREDLTEKYFIPDFLHLPNNPSGRIYRTGDLGRIDENGEIEFLGRVDTQVKIRGYRIELSEIESVMLKTPEIEQVVVSAFQPSPGQSAELAAYCTLKPGVKSLPADLLNMLRAHLPAYMIPSYVEVLPELPMLPSGKVDRKKLPRPQGPRFTASQGDYAPPETEWERVIANAIARAFNLDRASVTGDFFTDLGGHSLTVAAAASLLRKEAGLSDIGLGDFYRYPSVRKLAALVQEKVSAQAAGGGAKAKRPEREVYRATDRRVALAGLVQALFLFIYVGVSALPLAALLNWSVHRPAWTLSEATLLGGNLALMTLSVFLLLLVWPIFLKWLLLPHPRKGRYPLWGWTFLRWWMVNKATMLAPLALLKGTPLLNIFYQLMGAEIGRHVLLETHFLHAPYFITLGDAVSIGPSTHIFAYEVKDGYLHLRQVFIDQRCYIGSNSVIMPGAIMEKESLLGD